jgi:hypothetical protein
LVASPLLAVGVAAWALSIAGCTEYHPRPAPPPKKKIELVSKAPPGHHATAALEAVASTSAKARERLVRDAEKQGCDVLVVTSDEPDSFEFKGETVQRRILKADCLVRDDGP